MNKQNLEERLKQIKEVKTGKRLNSEEEVYAYKGDVYSFSEELPKGANPKFLHEALKTKVKKNGYTVASVDVNIIELETDSMVLINKLAEQSNNKVLQKLFSQTKELTLRNDVLYEAIINAENGRINTERVLIEIAKVYDDSYLMQVESLTNVTINELFSEE